MSLKPNFVPSAFYYSCSFCVIEAPYPLSLLQLLYLGQGNSQTWNELCDSQMVVLF